MKKILLFTILLGGFLFSNALAQTDDSGKLNAWTSNLVLRQNKESKETTYLKEVRVAKNKGFDRVVFEFLGDIPHYRIEYIEPPIINTADQEVKVSGKFFVSIIIHSLPYPDDEKFPEAKIRQGILNFPVISEVSEIEWFEGDREFVAGLKAKKLYRVQQLKNPTRLVIDFKQ
jgi:hypothetical protein